MGTNGRKWVVVLALLGLALTLGGCNDSNDGTDEAVIPDEPSSDTPTDTPRPIVAYGDSLTTGEAAPGVTPYPARVAAIKGEKVINAGIGGIGACAAANGMDSVLSHKPKVVLILFGTNNVLAGQNLDTTRDCLLSMIREAKQAGAKPVIGTIPPMQGPKESLMPQVDYLNSLIRALAAAEGVALADLANEFGTGEGLLLADGYHPNETGTQAIAFAFAGAF